MHGLSGMVQGSSGAYSAFLGYMVLGWGCFWHQLSILVSHNYLSRFQIKLLILLFLMPSIKCLVRNGI